MLLGQHLLLNRRNSSHARRYSRARLLLSRMRTRYALRFYHKLLRMQCRLRGRLGLGLGLEFKHDRRGRRIVHSHLSVTMSHYVSALRSTSRHELSLAKTKMVLPSLLLLFLAS